MADLPDPKQPTAPLPNAKHPMVVGIHAHLAGARLHDDHTCDRVSCLLCGKPGRALLGIWLELTT